MLKQSAPASQSAHRSIELRAQRPIETAGELRAKRTSELLRNKPRDSAHATNALVLRSATTHSRVPAALLPEAAAEAAGTLLLLLRKQGPLSRRGVR